MAWFVVCLLAMLVGLAGTVIPVLPGLLLILASAVVYALGTGLEGGIGMSHLLLYGAVGGLALAFGLLANALGTRAAGGSRLAAIGALVGLVGGLLLGGPIGLVIGPFVGAATFELIGGRSSRQALRSGAGAAVGILASAIVEFAVGLGIVASFVLSVLTRG